MNSSTNPANMTPKQKAVAAQLAAMASAKDSLAAYWAGSITASLAHSVAHGDVVTVKADDGK